MAAVVALPANALSNRVCLHSRFHSNRESERRPEMTYRQNEEDKKLDRDRRRVTNAEKADAKEKKKKDGRKFTRCATTV